MNGSKGRVQGLRPLTYIVYLGAAVAFAIAGLWIFAVTLVAICLVLAAVQFRHSWARATVAFGDIDAILREETSGSLAPRVPVSH
jgi:hypothetical protein